MQHTNTKGKTIEEGSEKNKGNAKTKSKNTQI